MALAKPTQITVPFSSNGIKNTIPETATGSNLASMQEGFPVITMTDVDQGGMPPQGQDMNGILFDVTKAIQYQQAGGLFPYDSTFAQAIDGYPLGALICSADGTKLYQNTLNGNQSDPENGGLNWQEIPTDISSKQDKLTTSQMDAVNSGITTAKVAQYDGYAAGKQNVLTFDNTPTNGSSNPVTSDGIYAALGTKQDTITVDAVPTSGSANPVQSGGVYNALADKVDVDDADDAEVTATGSTTARTLANRFSDVINVKDFGAKGDGVTDDTAAIQAAFNSAVGKKVIFPAGVYVSGNVSIPVGVKTVDGMGSTLKRNQSLNQFYFDKAKNLSIENFIFETLDNTIHGGAMRGREVDNISIKNIRATSQTPYSGTTGDWAITLSGNDIRMSDIYIDTVDVGQWGDGIHLGQVQNFTLENFDIESGDDGIALMQDRNCILDYGDTSTWLDGWTENIVVGNGIFRKPESGNNLFSCIKLGCNINGIDVDTSDHSIRNVLFHDIVFPDAGGRTVVLTSDNRTTINNKYKNVVFDACQFGDGTGDKAIGWDVETADLTFRNCNMRRNGYVQNFMQIENVDSFGMTSCDFVNDSAATGTTDFSFSDCQQVILKNNSFDRSPAGTVYALSNCDELISTENVFLNVADVSVSGQKNMVTDDKTSRPLLVVIAGQDNACGDSYSPEHSPYFSENGYQFIPTVISDQSTDYSGAWKKTVYEPSCKFHGGFVSALAKRLSELTGRNIWIVNVAYGGSALYSGHTPNWSGSGTLRSRALGLVNTAKAAMPSYDILGTVWLQGETDATLISEGTESLTGTNSFQYQLRYLINWLKNNIGGVVFLSKIAYTDSGSKDATVDAVNGIIENIPNQYPETSNCYLASSLPTTFRDEGLMKSDGVHYKQEGYDRLGISLATYLASFYEGL